VRERPVGRPTQPLQGLERACRRALAARPALPIRRDYYAGPVSALPAGCLPAGLPLRQSRASSTSLALPGDLGL